MVTVLLVEDDPALRATLAQSLQIEGWAVLCAASAADALAQYRHAATTPRPVDVVLLDQGLPDGEGADVLAQLGPARPAAVIVVSARAAEAQKVRLLDAGADDYLVKPFGVDELLARVRVALRHRGRAIAPAVRRYESGDLVVDLERHEVRVGATAVHLTPTEFALLARLVRSAGQVVSHRRLLADVWGPAHTEQVHYLRLYMAQLRGKLEADPASPRRLLTEPGVGYRLSDAEVRDT